MNLVFLSRCILIMFLFFSGRITICCQDTVVVQTLTFDSIDTRTGVWEFPDESETFRKILMYYTLKCDAATTADSYPCGEWDRLTNTVLNEPTGVFDSVRREHQKWYYASRSIDTIKYLDTHYHDYYDRYELFLNITDSLESISYLGSGTDQLQWPFGASSPEIKSQFLWTAAELNSQGVVAGTIDKIEVDLTALGGDLRGLKIKMKNSSITTLSDFQVGGFEEVYCRNTSFSSLGANMLSFYRPFIWDGTSNVIIQISYENYLGITPYSESDNLVNGTNSGFNSTVFSLGKDGYLNVSEDEFVDVMVGSVDFDDQISVSFWAKGDENVLPSQSSIVEGKNKNNIRRFNVHLPWANNHIYWDAGWRNFPKSRINKPTNNNEITSGWNHWAFTKNASNGEMKIWKNGVLWHSGTGKTDLIETITKLRIGSSVNGSEKWAGKIDEFRLWNIELDQSTIIDWMNKRIDTSHPNYSNLIVYYDFNDNSGVFDKSGNNRDGAPSTQNMIQFFNIEEQFHGVQTSQIRPNIGFVQGTYTAQLDSLLVLDSALVNNVAISQFDIVDRSFQIVNIENVWPVGTSNHYDHLGVLKSSLDKNANIVFPNDTLIYYEEPFEIYNNYELGRYITPYGIGLNLGSGFTWVYDVTDFAHLLHDSVNISSKNFSEMVDIKFLMIKGTPPRNVINYRPVWDFTSPWAGTGMGVYKYMDLADDVVLPSTTLGLNNQTVYAKLRTTITGHGHQSDNGAYPHCCEWRDNSHYLYSNGQQIADWRIWQTNDCALNPVYPQGGTWLGAREGWCPGDIVKGMEVELTDYIQNDSINIDYDITDVPSNNQGMGEGDYVMTMDLVEYSEANFQLDAEIYDVVSPNNRGYYSRSNPVCNGIKLVIRNSGETTLTSLKLVYQVSGGVPFTYHWNGSLKFMESEIVEIPFWGGQFWIGDGNNKFTITASEPNGGVDENGGNDTYQTSFELPDLYDKIALRYKTNNNPQDNVITITDSWGNVVYNRSNLDANTTYNDTLDLPEGCYVLRVFDSSNDGLSYWAYSGQGSGYFQIRKASGGLYKQFNSEFGREINHAFVIGNIVDVNKEYLNVDVEIFPNPNSGLFNVKSEISGKAKFKIINSIGQDVSSGYIELHQSFPGTLDLRGLGKGIYFVYFEIDGNSIVKTVDIY